MNRHKWFVVMSVIAVLFFVWVSPAQAKAPICCVWDPPRCCALTPFEGCSGCGLTTCDDCDAVDGTYPISCEPLAFACCDESTGECQEAWGTCCEAFGFTLMSNCGDCEAQREEPEGMTNASPAYDNDVDEAETSGDQASPSSLWVLVVSALLLLPAVPLVMRRRARRQE